MSSFKFPENVNRTSHEFSKTALETLLQARFFYAPAFEIYGGVAGLYDYGPPGAALQSNILNLWRQHFITEESMSEVDTTIMTLAAVLKTSGHVDRFTDWMTKDSVTNDLPLRADHVVEAALNARLQGDKIARGTAAPEQEAKIGDVKKSKKKLADASKAAAAQVKLSPETVAEYENVLAQVDNFSGPELGELMQKYSITHPITGNPLSEPKEFNLMFDNSIGPTGQVKGYLRPETAQGHFVNFQRLLEFNNGRVPFASAQIGRSFRNEIAPRAGLLRVREFTMAEIEHFCDPEDKSHPRYHSIKDIKIQLLSAKVQQEGNTTLTSMTVGEAVEQKIIGNETLAYFIGRIQIFLEAIGIDPKRLRFREHMSNEMAHYACGCFDGEVLLSSGWLEILGCADRSAYDLTMHSRATGQKLVVRQDLPEPIFVQKHVVELNKKKFGPTFLKHSKEVEEAILAMDELSLSNLSEKLSLGSASVSVNGKDFNITPDLLTIEHKTIKERVREFIPNVIEPSFGIGRILYSVLEHSYWAREEAGAMQDGPVKAVLSLPPVIAPVKVLVVPISTSAALKPLTAQISEKLRKEGVTFRVDDSSASIGKRYARNDELGTPFGITIDFATEKNGTITLRDRDRAVVAQNGQLIGSIDDVINIIVKLSNGTMSWSDACSKLEYYSGEQAA